MTGGDFVRNVKQCIDLLRQIGDVAPDPETRARGRARPPTPATAVWWRRRASPARLSDAAWSRRAGRGSGRRRDRPSGTSSGDDADPRGRGRATDPARAVEFRPDARLRPRPCARAPERRPDAASRDAGARAATRCASTADDREHVRGEHGRRSASPPTAPRWLTPLARAARAGRRARRARRPAPPASSSRTVSTCAAPTSSRGVIPGDGRAEVQVYALEPGRAAGDARPPAPGRAPARTPASPRPAAAGSRSGPIAAPVPLEVDGVAGAAGDAWSRSTSCPGAFRARGLSGLSGAASPPAASEGRRRYHRQPWPVRQRDGGRGCGRVPRRALHRRRGGRPPPVLHQPRPSGLRARQPARGREGRAVRALLAHARRACAACSSTSSSPTSTSPATSPSTPPSA